MGAGTTVRAAVEAGGRAQPLPPGLQGEGFIEGSYLDGLFKTHPALPGRFFETLKPDFDAAELLLVVGTSLEVHPFASLVDLGAMPRALINREKVGEMLPSRLSRGGDYGFDFSENATVPRDVFLQGDADDTVAALMDAAGWEFPDKYV